MGCRLAALTKEGNDERFQTCDADGFGGRRRRGDRGVAVPAGLGRGDALVCRPGQAAYQPGAAGGPAGPGRDVRPVVELRPGQQVRRGHGQVRQVGRQRRRRRHHPPRRKPVGLRRDGGAGLHLPHLVGPAGKRTREDLPGRQREARRRYALRRLLRRQARAVQLPAAFVPAGRRGEPRAEPLLPDPVSEVVQDRGRGQVGRLLPLQLCDLPQGDQGAHVQPRAWSRRTPRCSRK